MQGKFLWIKVLHFIFLFTVMNIIGYLASSYMTPETIKWYHNLHLSFVTPPSFIFVCVWSFLFLLISISGTIVWGKTTFNWFILQLILNALWNFSFFFLRSPGLALMVLLLMIFCITQCIIKFCRVSKIAGILLFPLLLWSIFALYLNSYIVLK